MEVNTREEGREREVNARGGREIIGRECSGRKRENRKRMLGRKREKGKRMLGDEERE